jgi:superfamily II DNA helicase RecQ
LTGNDFVSLSEDEGCFNPGNSSGMQIKLFSIPISDNGEMAAEMNRFLANHKVLEIEQRFYQNEKGACWCFCVRYITGDIQHPNSGFNKAKTDYKQVLSEAEFAVFSKLRECRKTLAAQDAVPAYAIFTDEELAGIAKLPNIEASKLSSIKGIGEKKVEKYGKILIELFYSKQNSNEKRE